MRVAPLTRDSVTGEVFWNYEQKNVKSEKHVEVTLILRSVFALMAFGAFALTAAAQSNTVLQGSEITESELIKALTPEKGIRTRSFKVVPTEEPSPAEKTASASLLITFYTSSPELTPEARKSLDVVGNVFKTKTLAVYKFVIEGHADRRGDPEFNQRLSQARAEKVRDYLVQNHHIDKDRLSPVGMGTGHPLNTKNPAAPENRRVTIITQPE